jgi:hypothetical protein
MYIGKLTVKDQLTDRELYTENTRKEYKTKQAALDNIKKCTEKYSDNAFGTIYVNYEYEAIETSDALRMSKETLMHKVARDLEFFGHNYEETILKMREMGIFLNWTAWEIENRPVRLEELKEILL